MDGSAYLNDQLLIAMPGLDDPNFSRAVTYVCQHNESGALGITINRASELTVFDVLNQLDIECLDDNWGSQHVLVGGPVHQDRGFVLHHEDGQKWKSSFPVTDQITLTTSKDILEGLASGTGPDMALLALGYAGWGAGQLESEMLSNSWLSSDADDQILFESALNDRWHHAAAKLGVNIDLLTGSAGHA
ncbi:MAG: YqgE/AlgH family protein [Lysobacterales bacterium]